MPTLEHNGPIAMFRDNPALAPHLLALLFHLDVPAHASVRVVDSALDQLLPIEFRADLVLELRDAKKNIVLSVVLESQRDDDARKKFSWPVYVTVARAERKSPAVVLVIAVDADIAAWAADKIDLGLGLGVIQPLVLGPANLPVITDAVVAAQEVELAVLSAMAHGNGPQGMEVLRAAFQALRRLDPEHATVYFHIIWNVLREPLKRALEALAMEQQTEGKATFPPFIQQFIDRGMREGELKGLREGELKGKRETLLRLIARVGIALTRLRSVSGAETTEAEPNMRQSLRREPPRSNCARSPYLWGRAGHQRDSSHAPQGARQPVLHARGRGGGAAFRQEREFHHPAHRRQALAGGRDADGACHAR